MHPQRNEQMSTEGGPGEGEVLFLEYMEIKVKSPQARALVHDQGSAGIQDGGGHALKGYPSV